MMDATPGAAVPPVLVLGLGNPLLGDDAAGLRLLAALAPAYACESETVEFVDGGTQGLRLLGIIAGRQALLVVDAVALGAPPGTVHVLTGEEALRLGRRALPTAHEGGAASVLAAADLLGDLPPRVAVVGIEPGVVTTGMGLSPAVATVLPAALAAARRELAGLLGPVPRLEAAHA